jgi:hypothetical protein
MSRAGGVRLPLLHASFFKKTRSFSNRALVRLSIVLDKHPLARPRLFSAEFMPRLAHVFKKKRTCKDKKLSSGWQKAKIDLSEEIRLIKEMIAEARPAAPPAAPAAAAAAASSSSTQERGARKKDTAPPPREGEDYLPQWAKDGKFSRNGQTVDLKSGSKKEAVVSSRHSSADHF